jgi:hypothetical protein
MAMATLIEVIATLDTIPVPAADRYETGPTIFERKPWTLESDAIVLREDAVNHGAPSAPEYAYLLGVDLAKEVIEICSDWPGGVTPDSSRGHRRGDPLRGA